MKIVSLVVGQQYSFNGIDVTYTGMIWLPGKRRYGFSSRANSFLLSGNDVKAKVSGGR